jgi:hypothetical protein
VVVDLVDDPEARIVDSGLLEILHPRQVKQSERFRVAAWVSWAPSRPMGFNCTCFAPPSRCRSPTSSPPLTSSRSS